MSTPTSGAPLLNGSEGTTTTVPRSTDNALWIMLAGVASCIINPEAIAATLDSASQLVTVIIVLLLVRSRARYTSAYQRSSGPLVSDTNA
ncbi:hypothetical protein OJ963_14855 [Streptomyces sp. RS2]|uniref:hypothetical protein n=1 Tax=Streptomyces sp. RS2 TaxID=1451205 RepID=UPI0021F81E2B|nr:hypothetical protein [Streptomyces sp. RS2]MCW1095212.1 hypothetical protein [Streptomyces sp. RS2]